MDSPEGVFLMIMLGAATILLFVSIIILLTAVVQKIYSTLFNEKIEPSAAVMLLIILAIIVMVAYFVGQAMYYTFYTGAG